MEQDEFFDEDLEYWEKYADLSVPVRQSKSDKKAVSMRVHSHGLKNGALTGVHSAAKQ